MTTLYDVLGISADADDEAIRIAFRKAAKQFHPDLNAGNRAAERHFRRVMAARELLSDPEQRARYDKNLGRESKHWLTLWRDARLKFIAGIVAGAVAGAVLFVFSNSSPEPLPEVSSLESLVEVPKTSLSDEVPDAESAEIKAMRDRREVPYTEPTPMVSQWSALGGDKREELMLSRPTSGDLASKRRPFKPQMTPWQRVVAKPISKRLSAFWRQLEAKIQSVKFPKT